MVDRLLANSDLAESVNGKAWLGIFCAWLGFGLYGIGKPADTNAYLPPACAFLGVALIAKGQMSQGLKTIEDARQSFLDNGRKYLYSLSEYILGKVFLNIVQGAKPISLLTVTKNIGFLVKNVPFASKKAEDHFNKAIEVAQEIGAKGTLGMAYLDLGMLHRARG